MTDQMDYLMTRYEQAFASTHHIGLELNYYYFYYVLYYYCSHLQILHKATAVVVHNLWTACTAVLQNLQKEPSQN